MSISFDRKLYKLQAIKLAAKRYQKLANFSLEPKKEYVRVSLRTVEKKDEEMIKDEFCNYVLYLMKSR